MSRFNTFFGKFKKKMTLQIWQKKGKKGKNTSIPNIPKYQIRSGGFPAPYSTFLGRVHLLPAHNIVLRHLCVYIHSSHTAASFL